MNIFLTSSDDVKLGDFGLTLTAISNKSYIQLSNARGTAAYISPETAEDNKYSHKTDMVCSAIFRLILNSLLLLYFKVSWSDILRNVNDGTPVLKKQ